MRYVIPILSLIISIIALAVALPRPNNLGIDYLGIIVAIISLATAFAVGFQIWNALSLETRLKELKSKIEEEYIEKMQSLEQKLTADINTKSELLSNNNAYQTSITSGSISLSNGLYDKAFFSFIQALSLETSIKNIYHVVLPGSVDIVINSMIQGDAFHITDPEDQKFIIKTIIESGKEDLIDKIGEIKTKIFKSED